MKIDLITLSLAAFLSFANTQTSADPDPNFYLFLCLGQSNMESGGQMEALDRTVDKRFRVLADFDAPDRDWEKDEWQDAVPPLTAKGSGICLVDYFGRTLVANLPENVRVGVVKVSVPGCKIELFEKDTFTNYAATDQEWPSKVKGIYDHLIQDLNLKPEEVPLLAGELVHADQQGRCAGFNEIMA
ncbi:MAG: hypothetical protein KJ072_23015 [Verrucomicrobia bacterium]|nr:hypothetical protein [Verrucomicrobiota bacterium]